MKKTLLCVLFLFSIIIYSQPNTTVCHGSSVDLYLTGANSIGNLNPNNAPVTFHHSIEEALNNLNSIANPSIYKVTSGTENIYVRIEGVDNYPVFSLTEIPALNVSATHKPILCKGDTASLSIAVSGGSGSYQYSLNGGPFTNNDYYPNLPAGIYTIKVLDVATGCTTPFTYEITEPNALLATSMVDNQNVIITAIGGTAPYQYSLNGLNYQNSYVFTNLVPGSYNVIVRDAQGCVSVVPANVPPVLTVAAVINKLIDCYSNASITAIAAGGVSSYVYSINGGMTFQASNIFNNLTAGTYSILVKDAANTVSPPFAITVSPYTTIQTPAVIVKQIDCVNNGMLTVQAYGGNSPYAYSFDGGVTFTNSNIFMNAQAGTYFILVRDSAGCVSPASTVTIDPFLPLTAVAANTPILCRGANSMLTITASGGKAPYQYAVNNGVFTSNNTFSKLVAGNYIFTVTDATNCIVQIPYIITEPTQLYTDTTVDGLTVTVNGREGTPPYQYSFDTGKTYQTNNVYTYSSPGDHSIFLKDANGCQYVSIVIIEDLNPLTVAATLTKQVDCTSNGEISVTASGGQLPYQYSIDGGTTFQTGNVFTNLVAGTYTVWVNDAVNSTINSNTITIDNYTALTATTTIIKPIDCKGNASIHIWAMGGTGNYKYSLNNGPFGNANIISDLVAGTYNIIVKDSNGCLSAEFPIVIEDFSPLDITASSTPILCSGENSTITINSSGGYAPYQYSLNNGAFSATNIFSKLTIGTYNIKVKDANGCLAEIQHMIVEPHELIGEVSVNNQTISVVNVTGGTGNYEYALDNGNFQISNVFTNVSYGEHIVKLKDSNNCQPHTYWVSISDPAVITAYAFITKALDCSNNNTAEITVEASGAKSPYMYSIDGGLTYQESAVFGNLGTGNYSILVKDASDLVSKPIETIITLPTPITATATNTSIICRGETASLTITTAGGKAPYQYSINDSAFTSANIFPELKAGTYTITVKDAIACTTSFSYTITEPENMIGKVLLGDTTATVINVKGGTGSYLYALDNPEGEYQTSNIFTNLTAGYNYVIFVKDSAGCFGFGLTFVIPDPNPMTSTATVTKQIDCNLNAEITVNTTGGDLTYQYSIDSGLTFQSSNIFKNLIAGNYVVTVKDAKGLYNYSNTVVIEPLISFNATAAISEPTVCGENETVTITAIGGKAPYVYSFDGGNTYTANNSNKLKAGTYNLFIKDANNCISTVNVTLSDLKLSATFTLKNPYCYQDNSGRITLNATGGKAPYTYSIGNGYVANNTFNNLSAGNYNVTVKDAIGCIISYYVIISEPDMLSLTYTATNSTTIADNDGKITVVAKGGSPNYSYALTDNSGLTIIPFQNSSIFTGLKAGIYGVQVRDQNGCTNLVNNIQVLNKANTLLATAEIISINCINSGSITINTIGGLAPYEYSFDNGLTYSVSNRFESYTPGSYNIKVRDAENNIISLSAILPQLSMPVINATITSNIFCKGTPDGAIAVQTIGGKAPYQYSLNNSPFTNSNNDNVTFTNLPAGVHMVTVRDYNGCMATVSVEITEPQPLVASIIVHNQTVTIHANGGTGNYKYAISPNLDKFSANNVFSALNPGTYTVFVVDSYACFVRMDVVVDPPAPLIEGENKLTLEFKSGQTLADLTVDGENIKWYSSQNPLAGKTNKINEVPLPLTTVLVDGVTYYASQTVNGIESIERLAVTAKLNGSLSTPDFDLAGFRFYPNPVKNILNINNASAIDEVAIFSVTGQTLVSKKINNTHSEIDLSNLSSGIYILKVTSDGKEKIIKFIKE